MLSIRIDDEKTIVKNATSQSQWTNKTSVLFGISVRCGHSGEEYNFGSGDIKVPFELIVAYAYACEHLNEDASTDPFAGVIPGGDSVNGYTLN